MLKRFFSSDRATDAPCGSWPSRCLYVCTTSALLATAVAGIVSPCAVRTPVTRRPSVRMRSTGVDRRISPPRRSKSATSARTSAPVPPRGNVTPQVRSSTWISV